MFDTCRGRRRLPGAALLAGVLLLAGPALAQNSPRVAMLEQAGWDAIAANRLPLAASNFKEAIALDPKNATLRLGAGLAAFLQRQDAEAKQHLEQALVLDPKLTRARIPLAQVWRRQSEFNDAIRQLEIAVAELPEEPGLRDTLDRWRRERDLHERMRLAVGDFFIVSFEGPDDAQLAAQVLESLTRAYWRICDVFGAFPEKATPVVLYTREQFRDLTRSPQWAAAAFDGIIRVPVRGASENIEDLDRVLAHEFSHALIRSLATRGVPTWLNEGLASALESDDLGWATTIVKQAGKTPSLRLLAAPFARLSGHEAALAYAVSTIAARRLLDEAGGAAVANLLRDLGAGIDFEAAFFKRVQKTLGEFETSLTPF
jgi:hypothetical protein